MARGFLDYLPQSVLDATSNNDFTSTVQTAMGSIKDMGASIMQPVGQQLASLMPEPAPMPMPALSERSESNGPQPEPPRIAPFSLGSVEDWGFGTTTAPVGRSQPQNEGVTPQRGMFSLPDVSAWMPALGGAQEPTAQPTSAPGPGRQTQRQSAAPASGEIDNSSRAAFVRTAYPYMLEASGGNKDLAEMMLAAAISENGDVGKGGGFVGNNFFGIKGKGTAGSFNAATWEQEGGQRVNQNANFAAYTTPVEGFAAFRQFLADNPRYAPALQRYEQTQNAEELFQNINRAGYATDTSWGSTIANIRRNQVAPVTRDLSSQPPAPADAAASPAGAPAYGTYTAENLIPNQFSEGQAQGLSAAEAMAVCGPAAAVAFARANGRNPTLREAKELGSQLGVWDAGAGMHGPASQVQLLEKMGVPARLVQGADEAAIAREIQSGKPVTIDTPGHYYVATGYDPQTRTFEFGNSAGVLKSSKGRTRYRLDELAGLGMGAPRATIFMGAAR